jgi:hypothetical protein
MPLPVRLSLFLQWFLLTVSAQISPLASTLDIMKQGNPRRISPRTNTRVQSAFNNLFAR